MKDQYLAAFLLESQEFRSQGRSRDEIPALLRERGCSKVQSIAIIAETFGIALSSAKEIVHNSPAWMDVKERDERFHDSIDIEQLTSSMDNPMLLPSHIDHTLLKPESTDAQIRKLCEEASLHGFASVCVMPYYVPLAAETMRELGSLVAVCTTIGFPNGAHQTAVKAAEARHALEDGARELDMVMNVGAMKSGHPLIVESDIRAVAEVAHAGGAILKVILETSLLSDDEKRLACELAGTAGADFVKTSTGFAGGGATVEDIRLMRAASAPHVRVKASGGIRDRATAVAMIEAGAERIGTSSGVAIFDF